MTVVTRLRARFDVVAREAAKFGAVGAANTVLDIAVFNLLVFGVGLAPLRSKVLSTVVAATSSYLMNRHWTFRHRERQDVRREYVLFFLLNAVGLAINLLIIGSVRYGLGLDGAVALNLANVAGVGTGTVFRFWSYRRFVWTHAGEVDEAADDGDVAAALALDVSRRAPDVTPHGVPAHVERRGA